MLEFVQGISGYDLGEVKKEKSEKTEDEAFLGMK
jgi:hypothetical protein